MSIPDDYYVRTFYMNRVVDLPPLVAQAAYDAHAHAPGGEWLLEASDARLLLRGPVRMSIGAGYQPYRSQPGTLITGWVRWPVELELLPWSDDCTEVGLRPMSRTFSRFPPDAVVRAGRRLLAGLEESMRGWAEQPLVDWANSMAFADTAPTSSGVAAAQHVEPGD